MYLCIYTLINTKLITTTNNVYSYTLILSKLLCTWHEINAIV